jgi:hypothetical protein
MKITGASTLATCIGAWPKKGEESNKMKYDKRGSTTELQDI